MIDHELNRDMEKCENIVSLGLALRSQKNIRVRQPLQSVTITAELSPSDTERVSPSRVCDLPESSHDRPRAQS
jgi:hypothetical protein